MIWNRKNAPIVTLMIGMPIILILTIILGAFGLAGVGIQLFGVLLLVCIVWFIIVFISDNKKNKSGSSSKTSNQVSNDDWV